MHRLVAGDAIGDVLAPYIDVVRTPAAGRCWVLANMVCGLDGTVAFGGRVGPLSEGADAELFRALRAVADIVLVGAGTVRAEGYGPVRLDDARQQRRVEAGRAPLPTIAVVSRSLDLDWSSSLFAESRPMVITARAAPAERRREAERHADVVVAGDEDVAIDAALSQLAGLGHRVVLCEGGPTLLGELVDHRLLDELCLTVAPVMGGDPLPVAVCAVAGQLTRFALRHAAVDDGTLLLRYEADDDHNG